MALVVSGDHRAFAAIVERHTDKFFGAAFRVCGRVHDAEDIVQEAFVKLWTKREQWKPGRGAKFTTWFYRVVVNTALDYVRRKKLHYGDDHLAYTADQSPGQDVVMMMSEEQAQLERAIQALPERQKVAVNLCFYEDLPRQEAADVMEISLKALESLLMRGKAALRDRLLPDKIENGKNKDREVKYA